MLAFRTIFLLLFGVHGGSLGWEQVSLECQR